MQSGRYDFIAAPTTVTKERAEQMLFTSGYLWTAFQFGIKKGSAPIKGWEDLKGKVVSVNKGTPYETLSKQKGQEIGFEVQAYDTQPDATQAVLSGRAYATLGGNTAIVYTASKNPSSWPTWSSGDARSLGSADAEGQCPAAQPASGRAGLHEEGRHAGDVLREVVHQEAGADDLRRDHARATACPACRATTRRRMS